MMQLTMVASFLVLLCLFGTIAATTNGARDGNAMTSHEVIPSKYIIGSSSSCIFGVKSVAMNLYTSDNPKGKFVKINESCNHFDHSKNVFVMTHGFDANSSNYNFSDLASELLKKNYTVFALDWANASCYNDPAFINLLLYPSAVHNTRKVGEYLAKLVKSLIDTCHIPLKNITLMGHSLGAHISGFAAKHLQESGYGKILLLMGTDPAAPLFALRGCKNRFCKTDAERVVVLHTSALGLQKSLGHLDLWFNNGLSQPKCGGWIIGSLNVNCSHNVVILYLASLINYVFIGKPVPPKEIPIPNLKPGCSSDETNCVVVDNRIYYSNYSLEGDYCVSVSSQPPFCTKKNDSCKNKMQQFDTLISW